MKFFMAMNPPTATHQQKQVRVVKGKPRFYEPENVVNAREKLKAHLAKHRPAAKLDGPIQLVTKWLFPITAKHLNGQYKTTRPDTDNLQKLLKDVMTDLGFWNDDAQVASEIAEKFWAEKTGIYIEIHQLPE